jgi:hypothetical protein
LTTEAVAYRGTELLNAKLFSFRPFEKGKHLVRLIKKVLYIDSKGF